MSPSIANQYYALSHRLRGIVTTFESINVLMSLPDCNTPQAQEALRLNYEKAKVQIEDFRKLLERRAKKRDDDNQMLLQMISTLYEQVAAESEKEMILSEINIMAEEIKRMIAFNRSMEKL